jgi:hypothetical protein
MIEALNERQRAAWRRELRHPLDRYNPHVGRLADLEHERYIFEFPQMLWGMWLSDSTWHDGVWAMDDDMKALIRRFYDWPNADVCIAKYEPRPPDYMDNEIKRLTEDGEWDGSAADILLQHPWLERRHIIRIMVTLKNDDGGDLSRYSRLILAVCLGRNPLNKDPAVRAKLEHDAEKWRQGLMGVVDAIDALLPRVLRRIVMVYAFPSRVPRPIGSRQIFIFRRSAPRWRKIRIVPLARNPRTTALRSSVQLVRLAGRWRAAGKSSVISCANDIR